MWVILYNARIRYVKEFENKRKPPWIEMDCKNIKGTITIKEAQIKSIINVLIWVGCSLK